ncbi:MAG: hypothetical protein GX994_05500 [Firmicutes bacterium]|nr:hypothetical protein [Bacillota bacterium]
MPSKEQLKSVGQSCGKFDRKDRNTVRSCESCVHWAGETAMCRLDIFLKQLESLDQT